MADERQRIGGPAVSHPLPLCCSVWFWVWPANFVFQTLIRLKRGHLQAGEEVTPLPPRLASPRLASAHIAVKTESVTLRNDCHYIISDYNTGKILLEFNPPVKEPIHGKKTDSAEVF